MTGQGGFQGKIIGTMKARYLLGQKISGRNFLPKKAVLPNHLGGGNLQLKTKFVHSGFPRRLQLVL